MRHGNVRIRMAEGPPPARGIPLVTVGAKIAPRSSRSRTREIRPYALGRKDPTGATGPSCLPGCYPFPHFRRAALGKEVIELDVLNREHRLASPPARIVSLVPSLTETLFDLGVGERIVGVTDYCIFPDIPATVARLGGTKSPDVERIRKLRPDIVYVNVEENLRRHAEAIDAFAPVFATEPSSVRDVRELIEQLGRIHRRERPAAEWMARIDRLIEKARPLRSFSFACPIWKDPWMWCGGDTYVSDLVTTAGGVNVLADHSRYPRLGVDELRALRPEVVFLPDEPYAFTDGDRRDLEKAGFPTVVGPFPGHLFTWHGTRTVRGLEYLMGVMNLADGSGEEVAQHDSRRLKGHE